MQIKSLQLLSDNLPATAKFYGEVLGIKVLSQSDEELRLAAGETVLSFHRSYDQKPQYHFAFNIPCNKTEEALRWMKGKAVVLEVEPGESIADFKNWNSAAFYFLDNNENIVELIARSDLQNISSSPFDGSSILSVSEIGIVVDDVIIQSEALVEKYSVNYFIKQPPLPRFVALGDDQGLFIVVPHNRGWYPTTIPSTKHWLKAVVEIGGREQVVEQYAHS